MRLCNDLLHQMFEQLFIEAVQPFRSVEKRLLHLAECIHRFVYRFVLCQPAPFSAKLRQSGADGIHAGGADICVQQAIGPQSADLMAFFCCFRDGPVDGQPLRMILPQDRVVLEMSPYDLDRGRITYRYK